MFQPLRASASGTQKSRNLRRRAELRTSWKRAKAGATAGAVRVYTNCVEAWEVQRERGSFARLYELRVSPGTAARPRGPAGVYTNFVKAREVQRDRGSCARLYELRVSPGTGQRFYLCRECASTNFTQPRQYKAPRPARTAHRPNEHQNYIIFTKQPDRGNCIGGVLRFRGAFFFVQKIGAQNLSRCETFLLANRPRAPVIPEFRNSESRPRSLRRKTTSPTPSARRRFRL